MEMFFFIVLVCGLCSAAGTAILIPILRFKQLLDYPNERSNHATRTPRGGGLAVAGAYSIAALLSAVFGYIPLPLTIAIGAVVVAVVSFVDDLRGLPARIRFSSHVCAVVIGMAALIYGWQIAPTDIPFTFSMILWLLILTIGWLWFINLYNFMDGIDGITGAETLHLCLSIAVIVIFYDLPESLLHTSLLLSAAITGFLFFNWHPAKIFLGDVGSITLGFLIGWMLVTIALKFSWVVAAILPMYYLMDSTATLLWRLYLRENIFAAHSRHFYQRFVRKGYSHSVAVKKIIRCNLALFALAFVAAVYPVLGWLFLLIALIFSARLCWHFASAPQIATRL